MRWSDDMRTHLRILAAASAFLLPCAHAVAQAVDPPEQDERVGAMYEQLAASLARLESLEYVAHKTVTWHNALKAPFGQSVRRSVLHMAIQGEHVYSRTDKLDPDPRESMSWEGAYNGQEYQVLQETLVNGQRLNVLRINTDPPRSFLGANRQSILWPLLFVFNQGDIQQSLWPSEDDWQRLIGRTTWLGAETVADHACDVVQTTQSKWNYEFSYRISLGRELDFYPVKWECDATPLPDPTNERPRKPARSEILVQPLTRETRGGRIVLPGEIMFDVYNDGQHDYTSEIRIDPDSLRINEPIDESRFTIPRDLAAQVIDESDDGTGNDESPTDAGVNRR